MKRLFLFFAILMLVFTGCANNNYKIAVVGDYPPYFYKQGNDYVGMYVDILDKIADKYSFKYKIEKVNEEEIKARFESKDIDAIFSNDFLLSSGKTLSNISSTRVMIASKDMDNEIDDLNFKKIGILKSSYIKNFVYNIRSKYGFSITEYDDVESLIKGMELKEIDKIVEDERVIKFISNKYSLNYGSSMENVDVIDVFANKRSTDFINDYSNGLVDLINSGEYENINNKYR